MRVCRLLPFASFRGGAVLQPLSGRSGHSVSRTCRSRSHVQRRLVGELGALLDEVEARFGFGAHQPLDGFFGVLAVVGDQHDAQQRALPRVHGGFLELRRHHLAQALEAADFDLGVGVKFLLENFVSVLVVAGIENLAAVARAGKAAAPRDKDGRGRCSCGICR